MQTQSLIPQIMQWVWFSELLGITGISIHTVKRLIFAQKIEPIFMGHATCTSQMEQSLNVLSACYTFRPLDSPKLLCLSQ